MKKAINYTRNAIRWCRFKRFGKLELFFTGFFAAIYVFTLYALIQNGESIGFLIGFTLGFIFAMLILWLALQAVMVIVALPLYALHLRSQKN